MNVLKKIGGFIKKYSIIFMVVVAISLCVGTSLIGYTYVQSMRESLWTQIVNDITEVTAQGGHAFEMYVQKERESLDVLANNLAKYNFSNEKEREEAMLLFNMHAGEGGYYSLVVLDKDPCDVYIAGSDEPLTANRDDYSDDNYPGDSGITEPYINNYTGQLTLGYYKKITFADGKDAIVRKGQLMSYVTSEFSLSFYNNTGFSYITKRNGDIIVRPSHKNSNRTRTNIFSILEFGQDAKEEAATLREAMRNDKTGAMLSTAGEEERVIAFVPLLGDEDWYIVSVIPNSSVSENVESVLQSTQALTVIIVVVVVIFVLFILAMYLFRRRIVAKEAEVKYREQLFGILANNTDDVFIMMPHGKQTPEYISPNISRVMGLEESDVKANIDLIGKPDDEDYAAGNKDLDIMRDIGEGETVSHDSTRTHKQTGEKRHFRETVYRASIDGVDKDIIVFSDRTEEKQAEAALTEAMEAAKAASQAKSSFLSSMSHDIRTPMNAIVGMTTIASKHINDKERVKDCLNKITLSSNHLLTLINDVLDISKIESGKLSLSPVAFSLRDAVSNLANIVRPMIAEKSLSFEVHVKNVVYEHLYGDMLRVNQIFINLLSNAVKYTPVGGKVTVDLIEEVIEEYKKVRLTYIVQDTGIGMTPEYMEHMYDAFTRAEDSRTNKIQGTGLGLAIVKQMVGMMNGTIDCESEIDKGTKFTVCLELPVVVKEEKHISLSGVKLLAVDDDPIFLENVVDVVEDMDAEIDIAESGEKALELIKTGGKSYSVVIVDWNMPGMSGLDTIRAMRDAYSVNVPIILVSAYDRNDIENDLNGERIDGFINKPLFRSYIYENLCSVLNLKNKKTKAKKEEEDDLNGLNILVAEDNDINWEVIVDLLDMYGITAERAENGKICVDKMNAAKTDQYDLILMDVQMPVMDGKAATREIRKNKRAYVRDIPIIAMTADAFAEDIASCLEAGMNEHLSKPVDINKLCHEIRKIMHNKNDK